MPHSPLRGLDSNVWRWQAEALTIPSTPPSRSVRALRDLVDSAPLGLQWVDADGVVVWANAATYEPLGYAADEYIGQPFARFHVDPAALAELGARVAAGEQVYDFPASVRCKDGSTRHVLISASAQLDERGRYKHSRCFIRDVTERRDTEAELVESQRVFQALAEISRAFAEASPDLTRIFAIITEKVTELLGDACAVWQVADDRRLELAAFHHRDDEARTKLRTAHREVGLPAPSLSEEVVRGRRGVRVEALDAVDRARAAAEYLGALDVGHAIIAPLLAQGRVVGTVGAARGVGGDPFDDGDAAVLQELADRAALAIVTARDHRSLQRERTAVRRSAKQLQLLIDALPMLVSYVGPDLRYKLVNAQYERWFGGQAVGLTGRRVDELVGPEVFARLKPRIERALAGETVTFEDEFAYPTGTKFVRVVYVPHRDADGEVEGYIQIVTDHSADRAASAEREALLRAEQDARSRLAVLARASELLTTSLDWGETLREVGRLLLPLVGDFAFFDVVEPSGSVRRIAVAHEDAERQRLLDGTSWARSDREDLNLCALSSGRSAFHPAIDDAWLRDVATSELHLELLRALALSSMMSVPLGYQGRILGALTVCFGPSQRRHTPADLELVEEVARRAATAVETSRLFAETQAAIGVRDEFLLVAGHELRTPLTALQLQVASITRMLDRHDEPDRILERARKAASSLGRFTSLVNELLDISRITAGRLTLERVRVNLGDSVTEVVGRFAEELTRAGCDLELTAVDLVEGDWDRLRIEQVVTNLLSNALKYGKGKPIAVRVERHPDYGSLIVRDSGIGISPEAHRRIFDRFERAVSSRHFGGLGLGLWITRQLVEAHGGTILLTSSEGRGAEFEVRLPLGEARTLGEHGR